MRAFESRCCGCWLVLLALAGCSRSRLTSTADAQLRAIYTSEWKWRMQQLADDEDGTRPLADHLPKVDPATQEMRLKHWQDVAQAAGRHRARQPVGAGAGELRHLPRAASRC